MKKYLVILFLIPLTTIGQSLDITIDSVLVSNYSRNFDEGEYFTDEDELGPLFIIHGRIINNSTKPIKGGSINISIINNNIELFFDPDIIYIRLDNGKCSLTKINYLSSYESINFRIEDYLYYSTGESKSDLLPKHYKIKSYNLKNELLKRIPQIYLTINYSDKKEFLKLKNCRFSDND